MRFALRLLVATLLAGGADTTPLPAQYPGVIHGTVTDALTGAPIEGATLTLVQTASVTMSDAAGRFHVRGLAPGAWTLRAERLGYATLSLELDVRNGQTTRADLVLQPLPLQLAEMAASYAAAGPGYTRIGRKAIENAGARTAGDAVRAVPGIVLLSSGPGSGQYVSIRGAPDDAVLVLVDGVPLNDPVTGRADLSTIDAENILSITILPGAASARFGARAAAGAVLIETRSAERPERRVTMTAGSLGTRRLAIAWADDRHAPWTAGAAWSEVRGRFPFDLPPEVGGGHGIRENADTRALDGFAAARLRHAGGWLDLRLAHETLARGLPGRAYAPSPFARQRVALSRASAAWSTRSSRADASFLLALAQQQIRHSDVQPPFGQPYDDTTRAFSLELRFDANRQVSETLTVGAGAQLRHQHVQSTALARSANPDMLDAGAFLHGELAVPRGADRLTLALQLRADRDPAGPGLIPSHSLTAAWTTPTLAAHLAHRSAFSPPTLADRFFREGVGIAPNPDLRAERVPAEIEAGLRWTLHAHAGIATVRAAAFRGNIRDMILWAPDFRFLWSPYNANVKRSGLEAALQGASHGGRFQIEAAAAITRATYDRGERDDSVQLAYRPRHTASLAAHLALLDARLSAQLRYTGARNTAPTNVNRLAGFWTLDAAIARTWPLGRWALTLDLRAERLLNETDALIFAFPEPGRRAYIGLRLSSRPN